MKGMNIMEMNVNTNEFEQEVLNSELPVLVDFWAPWCGPCRMLAPEVADLAEETEGKLKVCKVNVDDNAQICMQYGISSIPALFLFKNGKVENKCVGFIDDDELHEFVSSVM